VAHRRTHSGIVAALTLTATLALGVLPAFGQNAKIQAEAKKLQSDAMDVDFLGLEFKKAKTKLQDALKKCGTSNCDKPLLAGIHRDLGIVLINMKDTANGDAEFYEAFTADPSVTIAKDYLDNADVKKSWEGAKKGASPPSTAPTPKPTPTPTPTTPSTGTPPDGNIKINVTVAPTHVQLPIVVDAPDGADSVKVFYKTAAMEKYTLVEAKKQGGKYVVVLGCEHTQFAGDIKVYVRVYDAEKNEVDHLGSLKNPATVKLVEKMPSDVEPPMLPGDKEPEKCVEKNDCPPGLPCSKKKPEGSGCENDDECETDLSCVPNDNGTKWCHDTGGKPKPSTSSGRPKVFIGLHFAADALYIGSASDICNDSTWACIKDGTEFGGSKDTETTFSVASGGAGSTNGGPALGTFRALASFDYFVSGNIALGLRAGYAFNGNPTTKAKFLPFHAEGRLHFFPIAVDEKVAGFRPYISLGGGLGEFDAAVPNVIVITPTAPTTETCNGQPCVSGIKAYRLAGLGFAALGGGAWLFVSGKTAINFGARLIFPIPTFSLGMSAELGVVTGF